MRSKQGTSNFYVKTQEGVKSADYGKRATSALEFNESLRKQLRGGCREGVAARLFSVDLGMHVYVKSGENALEVLQKRHLETYLYVKSVENALEVLSKLTAHVNIRGCAKTGCQSFAFPDPLILAHPRVFTSNLGAPCLHRIFGAALQAHFPCKTTRVC